MEIHPLDMEIGSYAIITSWRTRVDFCGMVVKRRSLTNLAEVEKKEHPLQWQIQPNYRTYFPDLKVKPILKSEIEKYLILYKLTGEQL